MDIEQEIFARDTANDIIIYQFKFDPYYRTMGMMDCCGFKWHLAGNYLYWSDEDQELNENSLQADVKTFKKTATHIAIVAQLEWPTIMIFRLEDRCNLTTSTCT